MSEHTPLFSTREVRLLLENAIDSYKRVSELTELTQQIKRTGDDKAEADYRMTNKIDDRLHEVVAAILTHAWCVEPTQKLTPASIYDQFSKFCDDLT
jgi:hypothetical protein